MAFTMPGVATPSRRLLLLLAVAAMRGASASVTSPPVMTQQEMQAYMLQNRQLLLEIATAIVP